MISLRTLIKSTMAATLSPSQMSSVIMRFQFADYFLQAI